MIEVRTQVKELLEEITNCRRHLHKYPEIELDTPNTRAFIVSKLQEYGIDIIDEGMAENGVVGYLKVNDDNTSIGFRSDMDALPAMEENDVDFKSTNTYSHACGHDGHMATLLGFAKYVSEHRNQLNKNITFIFQPGEEGPGGAEIMIKEGLFDKFPMQYVIGTHVMGDIDAGYVASREGAMMARNGEISVEVIGKSAHGAMPHLGNDAIVAAANLIVQLQSIVSRNMDPLQGTVLTIGTMESGQARNIISDYANLQGTIRSFDDEAYELMKKRIDEVSKGIAVSFDVEVKCIVDDYYYVVNNDAFLHSVLKDVAGDSYLETAPKMIAEDFSYYQREVPGLFFYTGVRDANHRQDIHNSRFNFDESALLNAVETNLRILEKLGAYHD